MPSERAVDACPGPAAESQATHAELDLVLDRFGARGPAEVRAFVQAHPFLLPLLIEAQAAVETHFGAGTPVVLEVFHPVGGPEGAELFLLIQSSGSPEDALRRRNALEEEWWLDASPAARCRMNVDVEFR